MQIKHVDGNVILRGLLVSSNGDVLLTEEDAKQLVSKDNQCALQEAILDAKIHNRDKKKREIEELEDKVKKLKESL